MVSVPIESAEGPATAPMSESETPYTRLHITPFDESLRTIVIPSSVLPHARNISYHTVETFPEKRFGFVDLPTMDADKLKKKLNGAVLKGSKVRIETARPESIPEPTPDSDNGESKKEKKKKDKKRKREADVIEGVRLDDRKIKRGWTTTEQEIIEKKRKKAKKDQQDKKDGKSREHDESSDRKDKKKKKDKKHATIRSKYTDEPECLFKTKLPNTGAPPKEFAETDEGASTTPKKRKRKSDREVVVHEFAKTTKYPTFLKSTSTQATTEATIFTDGVGWVDSDGKVVEPVKSKRRPEGIPQPARPKPQKAAPTPQKEVVDEDDDETSSSGTSSDDDDTSSSGSDSESSDEEQDTLVTPKKLKVDTAALSSPVATAKSESARPKSSGSMTSLSIQIPPNTPAKKIHPLEALYKRPQGDTTPKADSEAQPFSFFGNEDDIEEDGSSMAPTSQAPMTPFSKQEFEFRSTRSAAPTPDTAHPSRSFNFWSQGSGADEGEEDDVEGLKDVEEEQEQEQEDEDADMADGVAAGGSTSQAPGSDFQKQFWDSRGDLNRAWRKRRKSAAKEKRYRDNKARAERAI
ncbi:hypothetical protein F4808DRAFT_26764 [Astrocystis sublimbata]|nr:hypothetical protein F4808DRAFT_26764 [Astrocystis sublimbata]